MSGQDCPYCGRTTFKQRIESKALMVSAIEAMDRKDFEALRLIVDNVTPDDYHVAVSYFAAFLNEIGKHGFDPRGTLEKMREIVNQEQAEA